MRLHNRIIKASFWTDTDLIRHLDRDGRMFYIGLTQLADDSGCLDDDMLAFKMHLYPADNDVDLDYLQRYRDKLVEMGKLIPYESEGKACLYLANFHKHQSLRSPAPPSVPLPEWIEWETSKKKRTSGKYIVRKPYGDRTVTVANPYGDQVEPEEKRTRREENQKTENARARAGTSAAVAVGIDFDDDDLGPDPDPAADGEVYQRFEQEFGRPLSPIEVEQVDQWQDKHSDELILEALKRAVLRGKMGFAYVGRILLDWDKAGIRTLADVAQRDPPRGPGGIRGKPGGRTPLAFASIRKYAEGDGAGDTCRDSKTIVVSDSQFPKLPAP